MVSTSRANPGQTSDEVLVSRCRSGNMVAFGELIELYQDRIFNAVFRMVGNYDDAQDLTQEAFLRALKSIKRFRGNAKFYTWLFRIAMNLSITHRQRVRRAPRSGAWQTGGQAAVLLELADKKNPSPLREAQIKERHQQVLEALEQLAPEARAIVVLRDIEQLGYSDIGKILEVPVGTVKSRLYRARLAVREQLTQGK